MHTKIYFEGLINKVKRLIWSPGCEPGLSYMNQNNIETIAFILLYGVLFYTALANLVV